MQVLKQSTARIVRVGSFVDQADGVTPETGVTLGAADQAEALKAGGGASVDIATATWAAVTGADGWYDLTLSTAVTDTVGDLTIVVQDASVCLPVMVRFTVVEEAVYDALYGASAAGYGTAQTGDSYAVVTNATYGLDKLARTGADSDTLETLSDQLDTNLAAIGAIGVASGTGLNFAVEADNTASPIKTITFVGVETSGTYANTESEDRVFHQIDDTGDAIDIVYQVDVGGIRKAVQAVWHGYVIGSNDTITVQAYDYVGSDWETRGTIAGQAGTANVTKTFTLLSKHTGTGSEVGKVLMRFVCTGQSNPTLYTDSLLVEAAIANQTVGYSEGAIWVDTNVSNENTEQFVDGVADNPVSTWAAALTLSASLGIRRFKISAASSITLTADSSEYELLGNGLWTLALGGQDISSSFILKASISGSSTGSNAIIEDCRITAPTSTGPAYFVRSGFNTALGSPFLAAAAGEYVFVDCVSLVAGSGTPYFNFAGTGGVTGVNFRRWSGGSHITGDVNVTGTMEVLTGGGQTLVTGGGNFELRGCCRAVTITLTGSEQVQVAAVTGPITINGAGVSSTVNLYGVHGVITNTASGTPTVNDSGVSLVNINAEADTAVDEKLVAFGLDHLFKTAVVGADVEDNTVIAKLVSKSAIADWDSYNATTDSLEAIRDQLVVVDEVVDAVLEDTGVTLPATLATIGGYVDCLPETWVVPPVGTDWTATRAGYVDKLNVSGTLAHSDAAATYKATGFSTHDAAAVVTALGTGSTLTALATAANLATLDTLIDRMAPLLIGTVTGAGAGTEVYVYGDVTVTVTVDVNGNVSEVVFS